MSKRARRARESVRDPVPVPEPGTVERVILDEVARRLDAADDEAILHGDPSVPEPVGIVHTDGDTCRREGDVTCAKRAAGTCVIYLDACCPDAPPTPRRIVQPFCPPGYRP